jgi:hypothetical protein
VRSFRNVDKDNIKERLKVLHEKWASSKWQTKDTVNAASKWKVNKRVGVMTVKMEEKVVGTSVTAVTVWARESLTMVTLQLPGIFVLPWVHRNERPLQIIFSKLMTLV